MEVSVLVSLGGCFDLLSCVVVCLVSVFGLFSCVWTGKLYFCCLAELFYLLSFVFPYLVAFLFSLTGCVFLCQVAVFMFFGCVFLYLVAFLDCPVVFSLSS